MLLDRKGICCQGVNNLILFVYFPHSFPNFYLLLNVITEVILFLLNDQVWKVPKTSEGFFFCLLNQGLVSFTYLFWFQNICQSHQMSIHLSSFWFVCLYLFTQFDYINGNNQISTTKKSPQSTPFNLVKSALEIT